MSFIQDMRMMVYKRSLKRKLQQRPASREMGAVNLKNAQAIGILFNASTVSSRNTILKYAEELRKRGKRIKLLGYFDDLTDSENFPFDFYNQKMVDWAYRPKGEAVASFIDQAFDLLMHIDAQTNTHTEYIAALSKAKLRVGPYTEHTYCFDLMIDLSPQAGLRQFIEQMETLLGKTNTEHEAAPI